MIIIIEGLDRCGKSTLVEHLRKQYFTSPNILVHHSSSPPKVDNPNLWELKHYSSLIQTGQFLVDKYAYTIIFDRFHLGAAVYGERYRGADPSDVYDLDKLYLSNYDKAVLILLTGDPKEIAARDDGDSLEKSVEEYSHTADAFLKAYEASSCMHKLHINITENGGFQNTIPTVINFLKGV